MKTTWFWCLRCNRAFDGLVPDDYEAGHGLPDGVGQMCLDEDGNVGWRCPYESCGVEIERNVIDWLLVQENHPKYPDVPEKGKVYRIEPDEG